MFIVSNLVSALATVLDQVLWLYGFVIMISVLVRWVSPDPFNPIAQFLRSVTEPVFNWIRHRLPFTVVGMLDLSPMVVLLLIWFLRLFLIRSLLDLALRLR